MTRRLTVAFLAILAMSSGPAEAQARRAPPGRSRPARARATRVHGYLTYGGIALSSARTFQAVAGTNRVTSLAGGVQLTPWRSLFLDVSLGRQRLEGQRVFVADGTVYPLGIPLQMTMQPVDVACGWRIRRARYQPYAGVGVSSVGYAESSPFARPGDDVSDRATGIVILAGVDVPAWRFVSVGGEVRYRAVDGVFGHAGASAVFDEHSLGGLQYSIRVSVSR